MRWIGAHTAAATALAALGLTSTAAAKELTTDWAFAGIGASQTTLRITALGGGCSSPRQPLVEETATTVRITARVWMPDEPLPCPANIAFDPRFVTLGAPLAGRRLLGSQAERFGSGLPDAPLPRVVGLAPADALAVLRRVGAKPVVVRRTTGPGLRRVTGQRGARLALGGGAGR